MKALGTGLMASALSLAVAGSALAAPIEIQLWHGLAGKLGQEVDKIAQGFNEKHGEYKVVPVYKGNYSETMTAAIAAFRAKQAPHIVQVFEVGTATMMQAQGAVYPVHELMADTKEAFDPNSYLSAVTAYYTTPDNKMLSLPFNSSTPVMFYNKDAFAKAGLNPDQPPKTWPELAEMSKKLIASGAATCGFTTGWPAWVQMENLSAWHDKPLATKSNGFGGFDAELVFNSDFHVRHIQQLADWQKDRVFVYGGRRGDANPLFLNGDCAMVMNSSAYYSTFKEGAKFKWGVANLPYWPDVKGAPRNSIIGGATFWVLQGHKAPEYKGVAKFFTYVSSPEVQAAWHQGTGYVPITHAAAELTRKQRFYEAHPGADVAVKQLTNAQPTANSKGLRLGNFVQIRDIMEQEMENVFAGKKTARQALSDAVAEGNKLLRRFEKQS